MISLFLSTTSKKYLLIFPLLILILSSLSLSAQNRATASSYEGYVFCIINKDTNQEKLNEIQEELGAWRDFEITYQDLVFDKNNKIENLRLEVATADGYSGSATLDANNPILYFYHIYNISKSPFHVGSGDIEERIPGDIKDNLIARGGGYEFVINPKKDQNFSPSRCMGSDVIHETAPKGLFNPVILLEGVKIAEADYLKLIREDYPMDEIFIEREEAVERFGDDGRGGAILLSSTAKD